MTSEVANLESIIKDLSNDLKRIPETHSERRNVYEIAGVGRKELVISNMLAFYLDKNQEHGLGTLFFDSLLELMGESKDFSDLEYEVFREYNYIDLLIAYKDQESNESKEGEFDWAIIIENKIHHQLNNDLKKYWKQVKVKENGLKVGVILSPWGNYGKDRLTIYKNKKEAATKVNPITTYLDLTHKELTDEVMRNIAEVYLSADSHHLELLKDYIYNIESMYMNPKDQERKEERLNLFQSKYDQISSIIKLDTDTRRYAIDESIRAFGAFDYGSNNNYFSKTGKHFFDKSKNKINPFFRFYIWYPGLVENGHLHLYFELVDKFAQYRKPLHEKEEFKKLIAGYPNAEIKKIESDKHYVIHFIDRSNNRGEGSVSLYEYLFEVLNSNFFHEEKGMIHKCLELLTPLVEAGEATKRNEGA